MKETYKLESVPLRDERSLWTLVENRSAYTLENCELNVFQTTQAAANVNLSFNDWVLTSMLRGKKVMHLYDKPGFDYFPGESVLVPPHEVMTIDFPEAEQNNPTQCIALAISSEQIKNTIDLLNERYPKADSPDPWQLNKNFFHLINNQELASSINRLIQLSLNDKTQEKDILAGLTLRELLIRLMQTQARNLFEENYRQLASNNRFAHIMQFIKEHITDKIEVNKLSEQACMSRAIFFRKFKEQFGYSPADYILQERLRLARNYLQNPGNSITEVCYRAGFQNLHYFIRAFKKTMGVTPKSYQQQLTLITNKL